MFCAKRSENLGWETVGSCLPALLCVIKTHHVPGTARGTPPRVSAFSLAVHLCLQKMGWLVLLWCLLCARVWVFLRISHRGVSKVLALELY